MIIGAGGALLEVFFFVTRPVQSTNGSAVNGVFLKDAEVEMKGDSVVQLAPNKGAKTVQLSVHLGGSRLKRAKTEVDTGTLGAESDEEKNSQGKKAPEKPVSVAKVDDAMRANIQCAICCSVFYSPVSLMPCLHSFCAGCYAGWEKNHSNCPTCRQGVKNVQVHHQLMSLAEGEQRSCGFEIAFLILV